MTDNHPITYWALPTLPTLLPSVSYLQLDSVVLLGGRPTIG